MSVSEIKTKEAERLFDYEYIWIIIFESLLKQVVYMATILRSQLDLL